MWLASTWLVAAPASPALAGAAGGSGRPSSRSGADDVLEATNTRGGLCVVLGSGDGSLAADLAGARPFVVHGVEPDEGKVAASRRMLLSKGLYGKVSVEHWGGDTLPYADNLVSMIVVVDAGGAPRGEIMRALRPGGDLLTRKAGGWTRTVKPRPAGMDEWTHWRHGPDRNPVSKDRLVDLGERIQYQFGTWLHRPYTISAAGMNLYLRKGRLYARDAFNGLPCWDTEAKADFSRGLTATRFPLRPGALFAAAGERVYFFAPDGTPVAHDVVTGRRILTFTKGESPIGMLCVADGGDGGKGQGTLVVYGMESIGAFDAGSGKRLWKEAIEKPVNVVASSYGVFYIAGDARRGEKRVVAARGLRDGRVLWSRDDCEWAAVRIWDCSFGNDMLAYEQKRPRIGVVVLSARTGKLVKAIGGRGTSRHGNEHFRAFWWKDRLLLNSGREILIYPAGNLDAKPERFHDNDVGDWGFAHCYPPVLTERFYINGQMSLVDLETRKYRNNPLTRGECDRQYGARSGYLPANGLIYVTPSGCFCFPYVTGNVAFAPAYRDTPREEARLVKGPAWGAGVRRADRAGDWPMFRHDCHRSGGTAVEVPADLGLVWASEIPGPDYSDPLAAEWLDNRYTTRRLTPPVVAAGTVYVAQPDTHRVIALDADTGETGWEFFAGGRVDTPPTIHDGLCIFGCRDGWVYCLDAPDGRLVWSFRAAPRERRISVYGQVESPTPVPGSVNVVDGRLYFGAGIHPRADGGIRVFCLEPGTGKVVWRSGFTTLGFTEPWPRPYRWEPGARNPWRNIRSMEYRYNDLTVRDGDSISISRWQFDLETGKRTLRKMSLFYHVKDAGVYMPRRSWRYDGARAIRQMHGTGPPVAFLGSSVYGAAPETEKAREFKLFRVDFGPGKGLRTAEPPVRTPYAICRIRDMGAAWLRGIRAPESLIVSGGHVFTFNERDGLEVRSTRTGETLARHRIAPPVWDGLAAAAPRPGARGRLYVSTTDGRVMCLGADGTKPLPTARPALSRSRDEPRRPDAPASPVPPATGAVFTWDGNSDGDGDNVSWDDPANWTADRGFPDGRGVRAVLNALQGGVNLNRRITLGQIVNDQRNNRNNIFRPGKGGSLVFDNGGSPALIYQRRGRGAQLRMEIHVDMELKSDLVYDFWSQRYAVIDGVVSGRGKPTLRFAGDSAGDLCEIKGGRGPNTYSGGTELAGLGERVGLFKASKQGAFGTGDVTLGANARLVVTDNAGGADDRIADTASVYLAGKGGKGPAVTLEAGVAETVRALHFEGARQPAGTWGSSASAAEHRDDDRFAGAGVLRARE